MGMPKDFPRLRALGVPIHRHPGEASIRYVSPRELNAVLTPAERKEFSCLFGVQARCSAGPYARDVEAVLARMARAVS